MSNLITKWVLIFALLIASTAQAKVTVNKVPLTYAQLEVIKGFVYDTSKYTDPSTRKVLLAGLAKSIVWLETAYKDKKQTYEVLEAGTNESKVIISAIVYITRVAQGLEEPLTPQYIDYWASLGKRLIVTYSEAVAKNPQTGENEIKIHYKFQLSKKKKLKK